MFLLIYHFKNVFLLMDQGRLLLTILIELLLRV